ncbi:MAG: citrate synthase [Myxococcota bacterium]
MSRRDPTTPRRLTADEAAARLGVKKQTLYAYVSRGLIGREVAADGRASLFDAAELDALRGDGRRGGFVVRSSITRVSTEGLWFRGHAAESLVHERYEDVIDLLWDVEGADEHWPKPTALRQRARGGRPIDTLRRAVLDEGASDVLRDELEDRVVRLAGRRIIAAMVRSVSTTAGPIAEGLWRGLAGEQGRVSQARLRRRRLALNAVMVLLIDHGMATSTLAARVAASTRADPYSVVLAALSAFAGMLHGGASAHVHRMFRDAEDGRDAAVAIRLARRRAGLLPGFGHSVYTDVDPRFAILFPLLETAFAGSRRLRVVREVRGLIDGRTRHAPNVDLALGALTYLSDMADDGGETIFAIARTAGWIAHALEEYAESPLRYRVRAVT